MATRVLLVDDHEIMREGMSALLRRREDVEIVGQAGDGRTAVELAQQTRPDIVIMDIAMPNLNGIEAARQIHEVHPTVKILALSTHADGGIVAKMVKAGAAGYILKESAFSELIDGINALLEGRTFLCSRISKVVFADYVNMITNPKWTDSDGLTGREREVLQLVAEGHTSKEIGRILNLSPKTVDSHREHIMEKLSIRTVAGLTKFALREGLTTP